MRFNYALRTSNRRKNLKIFVRKSERKNAPKAWKLWAMESSSGERRIWIFQQEHKDVGDSSKIHHFFKQDLPTQLEPNFKQSVISGITYTRG